MKPPRLPRMCPAHPLVSLLSLFPVLAMSLAVSGCAYNYGQGAELPEGGVAVSVFYGTDRNRREPDDPDTFYGDERGELEYGVARVTGASDDYKTRLASVEPMPSKAFLQTLNAAVRQAPEPTALVFVHGYLRSFRQISKLVAEFSVETGFQGVPLIWSWPSTTNPAGYTVDETNIAWAEADFIRFLRAVISESGARTVHLVGHSLGARSLTRVLTGSLIPGDMEMAGIGEVVLLAPDIDQDIFRRDIAPVLTGAGLSVTLYASSNDVAMSSARRVHGYRRAGDSSDGALVVRGVETIDVTPANRSVLGHSYFEESETVSADLAGLLNSRERAANRKNLVSVPGRDGIYWSLKAED